MKSCVAVLIVAVLALVPSAALAQEAAVFEGVQALLRPGDDLIVKDAAGIATRGKFQSISGDSLRVVSRGSIREFLQKDVIEIRQRHKDRIGDGAKKGLIVGAALGLLAGATASSRGVHNGEAPLAGVVTGMVYGAAIGAIIDASKKTERVVYRARVVPLASKDRKGVSLRFSF